MKIGYFLASEEHGPRELVDIAVQARDAGFRDYWISDHYHPWNDAQGHSGFVWGTIGALSGAVPGSHITTAVTCPTVRLHPAIIAQAAATSAVLLDGHFTLGVGTGEALNEHILGDAWPEASIRREMLQEAIALIRSLWQGGDRSFHGRHYHVENARVYDLPPDPIQIVVSGFGPHAVDLAARVGDGYCTVGPDAEAVEQFRSSARRGALVQGGLKVCYDEDERRAVETMHRLWPSDGLPGELAQVLPTPAHFEQAAELVTPEQLAESAPCGPDLDKHVAALRAYQEAGFDEVYVGQVGPNLEAFFDAYRDRVLPHFAEADRLASASA